MDIKVELILTDNEKQDLLEIIKQRIIDLDIEALVSLADKSKQPYHKPRSLFEL